MFGGGGQIASTEEAVNRVGFSEILKLVGTATAARMTERNLEFYGISAENLRGGSVWRWFMLNPEPKRAMRLIGLLAEVLK